MNNLVNYTSIISDLKEKILHSQKKAIQTVNKELVLLYWEIGNVILKNQSQQGWGSKIIDSLSNDLKKSFPDMKGFSVRNLKYMRQFASSYSDITIVQELLAQLSWYHNITIIQKVKDDNIRKCYANSSLAKEVLDWEAKRDLETMCRDSWTWQMNNPNGYKENN